HACARLSGERGPRDDPRGGEVDLPRDRSGRFLLHPVREDWNMNARARHNGEAILSARGIVNRFGRQNVHDGIDLEVERGEILGIAGGSGSGKTVLLKTLTGLHRPDRGTVQVAGKPVEQLGNGEKASLIGVLFQQGALFSSLSVAQNVMLPLREHTALPPEDRQTLAAMKLELSGLEAEAGQKYTAELSGAMVQLTAFARALSLLPL